LSTFMPAGSAGPVLMACGPTLPARPDAEVVVRPARRADRRARPAQAVAEPDLARFEIDDEDLRPAPAAAAPRGRLSWDPAPALRDPRRADRRSPSTLPSVLFAVTRSRTDPATTGRRASVIV
jgi:hypothetical protein